MNRLIAIGFETAGHWIVEEHQLKCKLIQYSSQRNVLYAFVSDGEVLYIGKTINKLATRFAGYRRPSPTQTTNVNNHRRIQELIGTGSAVEILVLPDSGLLHFGQFHLNLAAGLEDSLIQVMNPPWNGGVKETSPAEAEAEASEEPDEVARALPRFPLKLQATYWQQGFFNVGIAHAALLGQDGETIEFLLGDSDETIRGTINRRANTNNTPRLLGGTGLRDWFQANFQVLDLLEIVVLSPRSIRLRRPA